MAEILVKFDKNKNTAKNKKDKDALSKKHGAKHKHKVDRPDIPGLDGWELIEVDDEELALADYEGSDLVESTKSHVGLSYQAIPNDTSYSTQWHFGADYLNMPAAWDISTGSTTVKVAVLDSGCVNHPDLAGRLLWIAGNNVIGGGTTTSGVDVVAGNGHGTGVCGVIGATTNNNLGLAGIDWNCKIMPIIVGDASDVYEWYAALGVVLAVDSGAKVINMSFASFYWCELLEEALVYAHNNGVLCIAAGGNNYGPKDVYPACSKFVVSVGYTNYQSQIINSNSSYALGTWLCSPGTSIPVLGKLLNIFDGGGSSYTCAQMAGFASLLIANDPSITVRQIIAKIAMGAPRDRWDNYYGWGMMKPANSLAIATSSVPNVPADPTNVQVISFPGVGSDQYGDWDGTGDPSWQWKWSEHPYTAISWDIGDMVADPTLFYRIYTNYVVTKESASGTAVIRKLGVGASGAVSIYAAVQPAVGAYPLKLTARNEGSILGEKAYSWLYPGDVPATSSVSVSGNRVTCKIPRSATVLQTYPDINLHYPDNVLDYTGLEVVVRAWSKAGYSGYVEPLAAQAGKIQQICNHLRTQGVM